MYAWTTSSLVIGRLRRDGLGGPEDSSRLGPRRARRAAARLDGARYDGAALIDPSDEVDPRGDADMAREAERVTRAQEPVLVGGLPEVPGIGVAMRLTPGLGTHLRGLADEVLVKDYPGATLTRYEREFLA